MKIPVDINCIGKLCHVLDRMHRFYIDIQIKRGAKSEDIHMLCGYTAITQISRGSFVSPFNRLMVEIPKYLHWARQYHGEMGGLVHYYLKEAESVAVECEKVIEYFSANPRSFTLEERSRILLAYLKGVQVGKQKDTQ